MSKFLPRVFVFLLCAMNALITESQAKFEPNPLSIQEGAPSTRLYIYCLQDCVNGQHPTVECISACTVK